MRAFYVKMVLFVLLVGFCILFGVDIANRGMERIQGPTLPAGAFGPANTAAAQQAPPVKAPAAGTASSAAARSSAPKPEPVRAQEDEALNFIGNKTGDLLQIAAHHAIRLVVSLFGSIID
jgi:hypothetical protein